MSREPLPLAPFPPSPSPFLTPFNMLTTTIEKRPCNFHDARELCLTTDDLDLKLNSWTLKEGLFADNDMDSVLS